MFKFHVFLPIRQVAAYFTNLITVKFTTGLMLELCFGGRPLKFFRLLVAEIFTNPRLRTKVFHHFFNCNVHTLTSNQDIAPKCIYE